MTIYPSSWIHLFIFPAVALKNFHWRRDSHRTTLSVQVRLVSSDFNVKVAEGRNSTNHWLITSRGRRKRILYEDTDSSRILYFLCQFVFIDIVDFSFPAYLFSFSDDSPIASDLPRHDHRCGSTITSFHLEMVFPLERALATRRWNSTNRRSDSNTFIAGVGR